MDKNIRFCFKIDKSVGLAVDEEGNYGDAYVSIKYKKAEYYTMPKEDYENLQNKFKKVVVKQIGCDLSLITPITLNEYLDNTEENVK